MSQDKNNVAVVNTTDITHLINELRILDTKIIKDLSGTNGIIVQLNETITRLSVKKNLNEALIIEEQRIKTNAEYARKEVSQNLKKLEEILNQFQDFESKNEQQLEKQSQKIENLNHNLSSKTEEFQKGITNLKDSLLIDFSKKVEEIKNQINLKIVDIDLQKLESINENADKAINNITAVADWSKNVYHINILLVAFLSFFGGGILASLIFYFFLK
jgi:hypothetical protein